MGTKETTKNALAKIEKLLARVVGVQKIQQMTPLQFVEHATREIAKARTESIAKSRLRLSLLYKSVLYTSAIIEDSDSDSISVPVFVVDQTTLDEQASEMKTPAQAAAMNKDGQSIFEEGFVTKAVAKLQKSLEELQALAKDLPNGGGGAPPPPKPPTPPKPKEEEDEDDEDDEDDAPPSEDEEKAKPQKAADAVWPDDMNDPHFVEKGERAPLDWGKDR